MLLTKMYNILRYVQYVRKLNSNFDSVVSVVVPTVCITYVCMSIKELFFLKIINTMKPF